MLFTQELDYIVHARKVACILHDVEDLLIVIYAEMMEESKRVIMDREETGDEETTVHVEAWMEDDRVLICFYVDPEDLGGDLRRRQ